MLRWAREVCIRRAGWESAGSKDAIQHVEAWLVWHVVNQAEEQGRLAAQVPIRGLRAALRYFGWKCEEALAPRGEQGVGYNMNE